MIGNSVEIPCIFVCLNNTKEPLLREILAGIEEEGIPYKLKNIEFSGETMQRCIHSEAQNSKIGIAIGIMNSRIILQYSKLKEENPLINLKLNLYEKEKARIVGCNAARLYKIMPFKDIELVDVDMIEKVRASVVSALDKLNIKIS